MEGIIQYGELDGKEINFQISLSANKYLYESGKPLYMGMELYFTYFMMKKVKFHDEKPDREVFKVSDYLYVYFRSLQSRICRIQDLTGDERDLIDMPVTRKGALIPRFARIDRKNGIWYGDFTWKNGNENFKPLLLNR